MKGQTGMQVLSDNMTLAGRETVLRVSKRTMTPGDTLQAWGLAILAADVLKRRLTMQDTPTSYEIRCPVSVEKIAEMSAGYQPASRVMLPWLSSTEGNRFPKVSGMYAVDRDLLRDDNARLRQLGQRPDEGGDAPAVSTHALAPKYPLFQTLTNPGSQWAGYNSFVEKARIFWTPPGVEAILRAFSTGAEDSHFFDSRLDETMKGLGLTKGSECRRNPPGFLFPGSNKGPTMRLDRSGVVTGQPGALDWMMADRGDISTIELYLTYLGYFNVANVLNYEGGRVVAVPVPHRVTVLDVLPFLENVRPRTFPKSPATVVSDAALVYADAALSYVAGVAPDEIRSARRAIALSGVELSVFWMPTKNTYAVDHVTFAPLPVWLVPLNKIAGIDGSRTVIERHRNQLRGVGRAEGGEAREAALAYRTSLVGTVDSWLRLFPAWYRAVIAERFVGSWTLAEVEQITVALEPELEEIIHDPAFEAVTGALRRVTVQAHYAREARRGGGQSTSAVLSDRPGSPISPQYDLIGTLQEAAARHPDEFLRELCEFVAAYNDEAMRRRHALIRKEDLEQVIGWIRTDRRGIVAALIIAFGVSPRRRAASAPTDEVFETPLPVSESVPEGE